MKFLKAMLETIKSYKSFYKEIASLNSMSDRELGDMGLSRGDIYKIAATKSL